MHAYHSYAWDRTLIQSWTLVKSKTRTEGVTEGADHIIICTPFPLLQLGAGGCDSSRGGQGGDSVETNCWPARFGHAHHWRGWRPYWFSPFSSVRHFLNWHSINSTTQQYTFGGFRDALWNVPLYKKIEVKGPYRHRLLARGLLTLSFAQVLWPI